jgi:hypothetical protein
VKISGYLFIAIAAIILTSAATSVLNNVDMASARKSLGRLQIGTDTGTKQTKPRFTWQEKDAVIFIVGTAFLVAGVVMVRRN